MTLPRLSLIALRLSTALGGHAVAADTPAKRAITHEDVWLMKRVGAPPRPSA